MSIESNFRDFHEAHPEVIVELETLTRQWLAVGHQRVSIGVLWEVLRWQTGLGSTTERFKLNNNYRSHYARLIIERNPTWASAFEVRELRAA